LAYLSGEQNVSTTDKFGNVGVWPIETYSPNFVNFGPGVP